MVKIVEMLCPKNHCLLRTAYEDDRATHADAVAKMRALSKVGTIESMCALCGATHLHFSEYPTQFKTLADAWPMIQQMAEADRKGRAELERKGETFAQRRQN